MNKQKLLWNFDKKNAKKNEMKTKTIFSILCWNIGNPSIQRATTQAQWLRERPEDILVLTETKRSKGCSFLEQYFQAYGYNVVFPKPEEREFGVMIISKNLLTPTRYSEHIDYLQSRVVSVKVVDYEVEIIGIYVPSRNSSYEKKEKKKRFLKSLTDALEIHAPIPKWIFCGDMNILEPSHIPHYPIFENWEYEFYRCLSKYQLKDAFRYFNPKAQEYSWVGRTGDGYRYDHCFISENLLPSVVRCFYLHEPREKRLSDHSAIITEFKYV